MSHLKALAGSTPSSVSVPLPLNEITSPARKTLLSCGDVMLATGGLPARMVSGAESVELTPSETVSLAVYRPACV